MSSNGRMVEELRALEPVHATELQGFVCREGDSRLRTQKGVGRAS